MNYKKRHTLQWACASEIKNFNGRLGQCQSLVRTENRIKKFTNLCCKLYLSTLEKKRTTGKTAGINSDIASLAKLSQKLFTLSVKEIV